MAITERHRYYTFYGSIAPPKALVPVVFVFKAVRYYLRLCAWPRPYPPREYLHFRAETMWGRQWLRYIAHHPVHTTRALCRFVMWT